MKMALTPTNARLDNQARFAIAQTILQRLEKPLTLADIDFADGTGPLDELVGRHGGGHCSSYEFYDDSISYGAKRHIFYRIETEVYTGGWENDCGVAVAVTAKHKEIVSVPVHSGMTLDMVARLLAMEIRGIDQNRFA
ncbi:hypothetical protein [Spirosoma foliorum]|uniref:Uncharacterized protein n=1 Tax=Spirosoma foliorum TaxID=2710596 RepID=A0A7G5H5D3_9BACT|nr:hypothetical protein [Spirosoma foliorum]QMW06325.1 hypothetical protein H3H32_16265 [Spirosoma foliorum]